MTRIVTFLSDYGSGDEFVGVVHAVIARLCPAARVIDLGHGVPPQDVRTGARRLARALPFAPSGVHLAVVDPGVGGPRRAVALRTRREDRLLVGPDNGLLPDAAERFGGVAEAVEISDSPWRLEPVSATFHGRDLFAPVAGRLAGGAPLRDAGTPLDPGSLVRLPALEPRRDGAAVIVHVMEIDGFGNLNTTLLKDESGNVRYFNGSAGGNDTASLSKRVIVIMRHNKRKLRQTLAHLTSPGFVDGRSRPQLGLRGEGPYRLITDSAVIGFDPETHAATLVSLHPNARLEDVLRETGFPLHIPKVLPPTALPSTNEVRLLREEIDPAGIYLG